MKLRKVVVLLLMAILACSALPAFDVTALAAMPYRIEVDVTNQIVTIYTNDSNRIVVRQMLCSTGVKDATPLGTYTLPPKTDENERKEWYYFRGFQVYAQYATRVFKGIMFHSIPCNKRSEATISSKGVAMLGKPASHGCIRLRWQDAKFIAQECKQGTKVKIFKSGKVDNDLRDLLMQSSYTGEDGQSYRQYLGISDEPGVLSRFSTGDEVRSLQMRLRDLGIFADDINGDYRGTTVTAVRKAQAMLGMEQTGIATLEFQEAIYAGDAPADMNVTLQEGMSGPAVRNMQKYMAELGIYDGDADGVFDVDVVNAVKLFQSIYGFETNGVASALVQKAIYYERGRIKAIFALNSGYDSQSLTDTMYFGQVDCNVGIRIRSKPTAQSAAIGRLSDGDVVVALEYGGTWSRIQRGTKVGYVMNKYMKYYKQDITSMVYTATDGDNAFTLGYTKDDYYNGAILPAEAFSDYLNGGGSLDSYTGMSEYATVVTERDDVTLNLREQPSTGSTILDELSRGTQVLVKLHSAEWSLVRYNGQTGYLLNAYLEFWNAPEGSLGEAEEEPEPTEEPEDEFEGPGNVYDDIQFAVVSAETGDSALVYAEDSPDAKVLGSLKNGVKLTVVESVDGWNKIELKGHTGYMIDEDLQFVQEA